MNEPEPRDVALLSVLAFVAGALVVLSASMLVPLAPDTSLLVAFVFCAGVGVGTIGLVLAAVLWIVGR